MTDKEIPKIAIIVLNWNNWQDTIECLESLTSIIYTNYQVIVVDNGSTNESLVKINQWVASNGGAFPVSVIALKKNLGFAKGNNIGIRHALTTKGIEYIMILNNDTVVDKDFIPPMLEVFRGHPEAGLVGPKILDPVSGIQKDGPLLKRLNFFSMLLFYGPFGRLLSKTPLINKFLIVGDEPRKVYEVTGCCMFFDRKALEDIGMFDENTFLGWEECIIAEKLLQHGYQTYFVPKSIVYHKHGQSIKKMDEAERTIAFLKSDSYFQKNYLKLPAYQRIVIDLVRALAYSAISLVNASYRKNYLRLIKAIFS